MRKGLVSTTAEALDGGGGGGGCLFLTVQKDVFYCRYGVAFLTHGCSNPFQALFVCLFVCGISLTSGQFISELFPHCTRSCFLQVVLRHRGSNHIYELKCLFVAVGPNARFIVLPHWDNMS